MNPAGKTVLWWGRFDPDYSRNRVLRQAYREVGWQVVDFHPWGVGALGDFEARLRGVPRADLIHVPCFRQRDLAAATRFAHRCGIPLLFDPLISAYDKQVFERGKFSETSRRAERLRTRERQLFQRADLVLADTPEHARFFVEALSVDREKVHIVYVGAEEGLFTPEATPHPPNQPLEVLFYGSFIPLQGPEVIVEAARRYQGPPVRWVLLGNGPLRARCEQLAAGLPNVAFEDWLPYTGLPDRIRRADILLGVFGATPKTQRVIPNKVFQALACGKPLVTSAAPAYPESLAKSGDSGIRWVPAGNAAELSQAVEELARQPHRLPVAGKQARAAFAGYFSTSTIVEQLRAALASIKQGCGECRCRSRTGADR